MPGAFLEHPPQVACALAARRNLIVIAAQPDDLPGLAENACQHRCARSGCAQNEDETPANLAPVGARASPVSAVRELVSQAGELSKQAPHVRSVSATDISLPGPPRIMFAAP